MADEATQDTAPEAVEQDVTDESTAGDAQDQAPDDEQGADALGDAGKQALERMKARLKTEREARTKAERERDEAKGLSEQEKTQREAETAALSKANSRIVRSEVRLAAKGILADPADALRFLDVDQFDVDDDGNVDEGEIAAAIADLAKTKPYLAVAATATARPSTPPPDPAQGGRGGSSDDADYERFAAVMKLPSTTRK